MSGGLVVVECEPHLSVTSQIVGCEVVVFVVVTVAVVTLRRHLTSSSIVILVSYSLSLPL